MNNFCKEIPEHLGSRHCLHGKNEPACCWCGDVFVSDQDPGEHGDNFHPLTKREVQVARLIVDGNSNDEIAKELQISPHTAKYYLNNIMGKTKQKNRAAVAAYVLRRGIVS